MSEELIEPTVEVSDSAEPTKEISDMVESSTEQPDLYAQRCKEYQREQEQRRQSTIDAIMGYVAHTMSPYIYDNEELENSVMLSESGQMTGNIFLCQSG